MSKLVAATVLLGVVLFSALPAVAGDVEPADSTLPPSDTLAPDTAAADTAAIAPADTVIYGRQSLLSKFAPANDTVDFEEHLTQNPTVALFKSMVIPGWGQLGNHKYFKAVLCAGVDAWLITEAVHYGRMASRDYDRYQAAVTVADRNARYATYTVHRSSRNKYTWFAVITSFVSMFDAYVDAHLSGFPTKKREKQIGIQVTPDLDGGVRAAVSVPF